MGDGILARVVGGWSEGRLEKAGVKGESQQLPEAVWADAYATGQVVEPPYDLEALAGLYEGNSTHKACVDAKTTNIVGLGYRFVEGGALTPPPSRCNCYGGQASPSPTPPPRPPPPGGRGGEEVGGGRRPAAPRAQGHAHGYRLGP